jgi:hypothetical protein
VNLLFIKIDVLNLNWIHPRVQLGNSCTAGSSITFLDEEAEEDNLYGNQLMRWLGLLELQLEIIPEY